MCGFFVIVCPLLSVWSAPPTAVEIVRQSVERDHRNWERAKDYTFIQHVERRELSQEGQVRATHSDTFDVLILDGSPFERQIARDGRPLPPKDAQKVARDFDEERRKRQNESDSQRRKRLAGEAKRREKSRAFALEIPAAFDFRLVGEEPFEGQPAWIIDAAPRPGFKGTAPRADLLTKFRGRLWIEQKEYQWVKVEAETIAPVSFGWLLARLDTGAKLSFRQGRVNSELWLPSRISMTLNARLALLKKLSAQIEITFRDYRKFQTDSRLLPAEESGRP